MILVTGATGFLGLELVRQLAVCDKPIRALKRETSVIPEFLKRQKNIHWFNTDLLDYFSLQKAFEDVKYVYHCAAVISFNREDKKRMIQTNVQGTAHIVNLCLDKKVQKLVHVSSIATMGDGKAEEVITEDNQLEFAGRQSYYALSKHESEMEVFRGIAEGLNAVVINPSIMIGKNMGQNGNSRALWEIVKKGLRYYPSGSCGLVSVEDVAKSMIALMDSNYSAERYIINAENWSYQDLLTEIAGHLQVPPPSEALRPWMLQLFLFADKIICLIVGKSNKLTKDIARSIFKKRNYANFKIKTAIDIDFKPIKQTITEACFSS